MRLLTNLMNLDQNTFEKILPFLNGYNLIYLNENKVLVEIIINENSIELSEIMLNINSMYNSIFKPINYNTILFSRYVEIIAFYYLLNLTI